MHEGKKRKVEVWNFNSTAEPVLPVKAEVMSWEENPSASVSGGLP